MSQEIFVGPQEGGRRLDAFLSAKLPEMSRNAIQRAISQGEICFSDGSPVKKNHVTTTGEVFFCALAPPAEMAATPQAIPLDVVYEDVDLIVVNKPRGMVVHPAPGHFDGTLVNALLHHCQGNLSGIGGILRPGVVHRLDKDTSGLCVAAKSDRAHRSLSHQLAAREMSRIYEGIIIGRLGQDRGVIDLPIGRHPKDRKRMSVHAKAARPAVTHFTVLARYGAYTHIRCTLETGRTHQIRVHMAHLGHPLLGDLTYGRRRPERGISGQCLHARTLAFAHPVTGEQMTFTTDLPAYFTEVLSRLGPAEPV